MRHPFASIYSQRLSLACLCVLLSSSIDAFAQDRPLVFRGARIHTVSGETIPSGTIVVEGGRIRTVGPVDEIVVPDGATVVELAGRVVIPGLVDTHSHLGVYPRPRVEAHSDGNERTGPVQSVVRAVDALWPGDPGIRMAQAGGITTANVMPGSGNVIGGQTAYVKLRPGTVEEMLICRKGICGGMKMANGENPKRAYGRRNQAPATRMAVAALQRQWFVKAENYRQHWRDYEAKRGQGEAAEPPERDLALEPIVEVLERRRTVHFHTHRADDILTILRLKEEFGFEVVLQHVTEGYLVAEEIARNNVPCSVIIVESPGGKHEAARLSFENPGRLEEAGVKVSIHTDDPITESRLFLRAGGLAVRGGMSEAGALRSLTLHAAEMLDLEDRIGSIEPGKDADLVVLSGPPFSVYTQVLATYVEGVKVFDRSRPEDLRYATGGFSVRERYPARAEEEER